MALLPPAFTPFLFPHLLLIDMILVLFFCLLTYIMCFKTISSEFRMTLEINVKVFVFHDCLLLPISYIHLRFLLVKGKTNVLCSKSFNNKHTRNFPLHFLLYKTLKHQYVTIQYLTFTRRFSRFSFH